MNEIAVVVVQKCRAPRCLAIVWLCCPLHCARIYTPSTIRPFIVSNDLEKSESKYQKPNCCDFASSDQRHRSVHTVSSEERWEVCTHGLDIK